MVSYSCSEGEEMNVVIENGKCQFQDNLHEWGKNFHDGKRYFCNIAGTRKFNTGVWRVFDDKTFEWSDDSNETKEMDSLEAFFQRKRINSSDSVFCGARE